MAECKSLLEEDLSPCEKNLTRVLKETDVTIIEELIPFIQPIIAHTIHIHHNYVHSDPNADCSTLKAESESSSSIDKSKGPGPGLAVEKMIYKVLKENEKKFTSAHRKIFSFLVFSISIWKRRLFFIYFLFHHFTCNHSFYAQHYQPIHNHNNNHIKSEMIKNNENNKSSDGPLAVRKLKSLAFVCDPCIDNVCSFIKHPNHILFLFLTQLAQFHFPIKGLYVHNDNDNNINNINNNNLISKNAFVCPLPINFSIRYSLSNSLAQLLLQRFFLHLNSNNHKQYIHSQNNKNNNNNDNNDSRLPLPLQSGSLFDEYFPFYSDYSNGPEFINYLDPPRMLYDLHYDDNQLDENNHLIVKSSFELINFINSINSIGPITFYLPNLDHSNNFTEVQAYIKSKYNIIVHKSKWALNAFYCNSINNNNKNKSNSDKNDNNNDDNKDNDSVDNHPNIYLMQSDINLFGLEVQDEGSQLISQLLIYGGKFYNLYQNKNHDHNSNYNDANNNMSTENDGCNILDYCAGAGGKTIHLVRAKQILGSKGKVIVHDIDSNKLNRLITRISKIGLAHKIIVAFPNQEALDNALDIQNKKKNKFYKSLEKSKYLKNSLSSNIDNNHNESVSENNKEDGYNNKMLFDIPMMCIEKVRCGIILVDSPCSQLGVLRRSNELRHQINFKLVNDFAQLQFSILKNILLNHWDPSLPNARIVYATCSLTVQENEQVVDRVLAFDERICLANCESKVIPSEILINEGRHMLLCPHRHNTDGFFAAIFVPRT